MGCSLGNAQTQTCNKEIYDPEGDSWNCVNYTVYTYACCSAGTEYACDMLDHGSYTRLNPPASPNACEDEYDTATGYTQSGEIYNQYWRSDDPNCERRSCQELVTEYYVNTTCLDMDQVCSCQDICNSSAPTNLSVAQGASGTAANVSWSAGSGGG